MKVWSRNISGFFTLLVPLVLFWKFNQVEIKLVASHKTILVLWLDVLQLHCLVQQLRIKQAFTWFNCSGEEMFK